MYAPITKACHAGVNRLEIITIRYRFYDEDEERCTEYTPAAPGGRRSSWASASSSSSVGLRVKSDHGSIWNTDESESVMSMSPSIELIGKCKQNIYFLFLSSSFFSFLSFLILS